MATKKSRNVLAEAIRRLRESLGESQMAFATRMGWHLVTLARYETNYQPNDRALAQLFRLALERDEQYLVRVFLGAVRAEIGETAFVAPKGFESAVDAFILVLGNPKLEKLRAEILDLLAPTIELTEATHAAGVLLREEMKMLREERKGKKK